MNEENQTQQVSAQETETVKTADEVYCSSCGAVIKKDTEICPKCGVRQKSGTATKSWGVLVVLSLFLGELGIDRFYAGNIGLGLVKLFLIIAITVIVIITTVITMGLGIVGVVLYIIPGIWWLIDLILALCGKIKDKYGNPIK
jgi:TM2 domain-containing membrane protein YozV